MHAVHPLAVKAVDILSKGNPGDQFNRSQLSSLLGVSCEPGGEGIKRLNTAKKICYREHRKLWKWCHVKDGESTFVCCGHVEVLKEIDSERKRLNRTSHRLNVKSMCLDETKLSEDEKAQYRATQVVGTVVNNVSRSRTVTKLMGSGFDLIAPDSDKLLELMKK
jgi:hypothetical protein